MNRSKPLVIQVMERSRTGGTSRLVLLGYAYYGDPDGTSITPSPKSVAKRAGVSVRTVERYRPKLIELGELVVVDREAHGEHVEYAIALPAERTTSRPRQGHQGRGHSRARGRQSSQVGGAVGEPRAAQRRQVVGRRLTKAERVDDEVTGLLAESEGHP